METPIKFLLKEPSLLYNGKYFCCFIIVSSNIGSGRDKYSASKEPINKKGNSTILHTSSNKFSFGLKFNPALLVSFFPEFIIASFRSFGLIMTLAFNS